MKVLQSCYCGSLVIAEVLLIKSFDFERLNNEPRVLAAIFNAIRSISLKESW